MKRLTKRNENGEVVLKADKERRIELLDKDMLWEDYDAIRKAFNKLAKYEDIEERKNKGCMNCNGKLPICYTRLGIEKKMNYCATCGRNLMNE